MNVISPRIALRRLKCGYQLFKSPVRNDEPSSVKVRYVPTGRSSNVKHDIDGKNPQIYVFRIYVVGKARYR
jgi:hypothetical protein